MKWYPNLPYNPLFPVLFEKEKQRIKKFLNVAIEHIGSTSVINLDGKGYIDIIVAVPENKISESKKILEEKLGYKYGESGSVKGKRLFFRRVAPSKYSKETVYHLHLTYSESGEFSDAISFRNFLLSHPDYVDRYSKIKKIASKEAQKSKNREEAEKTYKKIKSPLISEILQKIHNDKKQ